MGLELTDEENPGTETELLTIMYLTRRSALFVRCEESSQAEVNQIGFHPKIYWPKYTFPKC